MEIGVYRNLDKGVPNYVRKAHLPNQDATCKESEYCAASIAASANQQLETVGSQYRVGFFDINTGKLVHVDIK
jgi:hypothetical protein